MTHIALITVDIIKSGGSETGTSAQPKNMPRAWWPAMVRGFFRKCPSCGTGNLFYAFLKVANRCPDCHEELHHHRADDAPPYFTIFILGHILVPGVLVVEKIWRPEIWVHLSIWFPLTIILSIWLLPRLKGATLALQWALYMHGFEYSALCRPVNPDMDRDKTLIDG